ncbi:YHYH domain-containing protein [Pseudoalteromonas sp. T1lg88]|uniref:YHYH domain-containing protein n=1 Tax=Pseudoalteromonas sp. T1lg88 TaxID=2077104 RepID=UPI000CF74B11
MKKTLIIVALASVFSFTVGAHSGRTNASGCHTDHSNGSYHCHNAKTPSPTTITYCHVLNGERRCGYAYSTCSSLVRKYGGTCEIS